MLVAIYEQIELHLHNIRTVGVTYVCIINKPQLVAHVCRIKVLFWRRVSMGGLVVRHGPTFVEFEEIHIFLVCVNNLASSAFTDGQDLSCIFTNYIVFAEVLASIQAEPVDL